MNKRIPNLTEMQAARFWSKVNKEGPIPEHAKHLGPCWEWTGATDGFGYGIVAIHRKNYLTHRVVISMAFGRFAASSLHHCDNKTCLNPGHLFLGSDLDNTRDRLIKHHGLAPSSFDRSRTTSVGRNAAAAVAAMDAIIRTFGEPMPLVDVLDKAVRDAVVRAKGGKDAK